MGGYEPIRFGVGNSKGMQRVPIRNFEKFAREIGSVDELYVAIGGKDKVDLKYQPLFEAMFKEIAGEDKKMDANEIFGFFKQLDKAAERNGATTDYSMDMLSGDELYQEMKENDVSYAKNKLFNANNKSLKNAFRTELELMGDILNISDVKKGIEETMLQFAEALVKVNDKNSETDGVDLEMLENERQVFGEEDEQYPLVNWQKEAELVHKDMEKKAQEKAELEAKANKTITEGHVTYIYDEKGKLKKETVKFDNSTAVYEYDNETGKHTETFRWNDGTVSISYYNKDGKETKYVKIEKDSKYTQTINPKTGKPIKTIFEEKMEDGSTVTSTYNSEAVLTQKICVKENGTKLIDNYTDNGVQTDHTIEIYDKETGKLDTSRKLIYDSDGKVIKEIYTRYDEDGTQHTHESAGK